MSEQLLTKILEKLEQMDNRLINVEQSQAKMENELTDKVRALFDAREVQFDANDRIVESLSRIESKLDRMTFKVATHDSVIQRVK